MVMIKLMMTFCSVHDAVDGVCRSRQPGNDICLGVEISIIITVVAIVAVVCCCLRKSMMFSGIILGGKTG